MSIQVLFVKIFKLQDFPPLAAFIPIGIYHHFNLFTSIHTLFVCITVSSVCMGRHRCVSGQLQALVNHLPTSGVLPNVALFKCLVREGWRAYFMLPCLAARVRNAELPVEVKPLLIFELTCASHPSCCTADKSYVKFDTCLRTSNNTH